MATFKDYDKKIRETEQQKKKLLPFKVFNFLTPDYIALQKKRQKRLLARTYENREEKRLWSEYVRIVKESFKNDNKHQKFSLSHVDALGINRNITFIYGKKDSGKTWAVAAHIRRLLEKFPDATIAFIRNSKEESKGFVQMMNESDVWITWSNGEYIYKKEDVRKNKGKIQGLKPCGIFCYASGAGFTRWQGGDWPNLRLVWWDECNSIQGGLTTEVFQSFVVLQSSLIRDKEAEKKVETIMTGNLLEKSNIFLERLGVGSKTRLKLFDVYKDNNPKKELLSRLLYLNTGELFRGIENQKGLPSQFLTEDELEGLLSNRPGLSTGKAQYEEIELENFINLFSFVFRESQDSTAGATAKFVDYILYAYNVPGTPRIVIWIDQFKTTKIKKGFSSIFCNDSLLANSYSMTIPIEAKEDFGEMFIERLEQQLLIGEVWFGWNGSLEVFEDSWPRLRTKYIVEDDKSV